MAVARRPGMIIIEPGQVPHARALHLQHQHRWQAALDEPMIALSDPVPSCPPPPRFIFRSLCLGSGWALRWLADDASPWVNHNHKERVFARLRPERLQICIKAARRTKRNDDCRHLP